MESIPQKLMEFIRRIRIGQALGYVGGGMILGWALLKAFGITHSPVWAEMVPFFGASIGVGAIVFNAGRILEMVECIDQRLTRLEANFRVDSTHR